jgi:hypothetical protein
MYLITYMLRAQFHIILYTCVQRLYGLSINISEKTPILITQKEKNIRKL